MLDSSNNMATHSQPQSQSASSELFNHRITSIQGLRHAIQDSAFLSIDIKHVAMTGENDHILHQVGLAYFPLMQHDANAQPKPGRQHLQDFYTRNQLKALTLNINTSQGKEDGLRHGRQTGMSVRCPHRFGQEQQVDLEDLEAVFLAFIINYSQKESLVMVGFGIEAEWVYLSTYFPQVMCFFSAWADLHDIAKDIAPAGRTPGLTSLLRIFRYHREDVEPSRRDRGCGIGHNAGDGAVATCALIDDLLISANQDKLRLRQDCGVIGGTFAKKAGFQVPDAQHPFTATISTRGPLPPTLNSGMKVARRFFAYSPLSTGVMSEHVAYITFRSKDQLDQFIAAVHRQALPMGRRLLVRQYYPGETRRIRFERRQRETDQDQEERERLEKARKEIEDLERLFS